jgi:hypothetical protein
MIPDEQLKRIVEMSGKKELTAWECSELGNLLADFHALEVAPELLALREQTRWRKYPDEKPEEDARVLVLVRFSDNKESQDFVLIDDYENGKFDTFYKKDVKKWIPLPEGGKE